MSFFFSPLPPGRNRRPCRSARNSRSTPTPPAISSIRRSRRMPRAISWWPGRATARAGAIPRPPVSRASATPREAARSEGSSRSTPTPIPLSLVRRSRRMPGGISSWSGRATARAGAIPRPGASRASATPREAPRWEASSRSTPTPPTISLLRRSRRMSRGISWWSGRATARAGAIPRTTASRASATPREAPRWEGSSCSTPTPFPLSLVRRSRRMPGGDFVVVWQSYGSSGGDTSYSSVQGQRYAAGGAALGGEFQVNAYTTSTQRYPSVGRMPRGISWWSGRASARAGAIPRPPASRASATPPEAPR